MPSTCCREFRTAAAIDALARRPASYLIAVPSIFRLLMLHERADDAFRHCRVAVYGGAPMPTPWIEELARRWPSLRLFNCYGLTEFTSVSHLLAPELARTRATPSGGPVEGVRHQIVDDAGRLLPPGEVGEIVAVRADADAGLLASRGRDARGLSRRLAAHR